LCLFKNYFIKEQRNKQSFGKVKRFKKGSLVSFNICYLKCSKNKHQGTHYNFWNSQIQPDDKSLSKLFNYKLNRILKSEEPAKLPIEMMKIIKPIEAFEQHDYLKSGSVSPPDISSQYLTNDKQYSK